MKKVMMMLVLVVGLTGCGRDQGPSFVQPANPDTKVPGAGDVKELPLVPKK